MGHYCQYSPVVDRGPGPCTRSFASKPKDRQSALLRTPPDSNRLCQRWNEWLFPAQVLQRSSVSLEYLPRNAPRCLRVLQCGFMGDISNAVFRSDASSETTRLS